MKRFFIFLALAAMCAASCTKNEIAPIARDNAITFMPANYAQTRVSGSVFPTTETFSTYAWTAGTTGEYFINNETVSYDASGATPIWKTATTYYWPANQPVDFFSYYPTGFAGITVGKEQISFTNNFADDAKQLDIMYADKVVKRTGNGDGSDVLDGVNNYTGVPTFFRHAGAKIRCNLVAGTMETLAADSTKTRWEITVTGITLNGIYTSGSATLNLSDTTSTAFGIIPWTAPTDTNGYKVWTNDGTVCDPATDPKFADFSHYVLTTTGQSQENVIPEMFVLPQTLVAGQQKVRITFDVKTYITPKGLAEFLSTSQTGVVATADLTSLAIPAWQMNQSTLYTLILNPTGSYVPKPIYWDPAIADWDNTTNESGNVYFNLNL